jgi:hypothetical protein
VYAETTYDSNGPKELHPNYHNRTLTRSENSSTESLNTKLMGGGGLGGVSSPGPVDIIGGILPTLEQYQKLKAQETVLISLLPENLRMNMLAQDALKAQLSAN